MFAFLTTNPELFDPLLDVVDVRAELQASQLAQFGFTATQPGTHGLQVRDELLPLLEVLLVLVLVTHCLSLQQLPALDYACMEDTFYTALDLFIGEITYCDTP